MADLGYTREELVEAVRLAAQIHYGQATTRQVGVELGKLVNAREGAYLFAYGALDGDKGLARDLNAAAKAGAVRKVRPGGFRSPAMWAPKVED